MGAQERPTRKSLFTKSNAGKKRGESQTDTPVPRSPLPPTTNTSFEVPQQGRDAGTRRPTPGGVLPEAEKSVRSSPPPNGPKERGKEDRKRKKGYEAVQRAESAPTNTFSPHRFKSPPLSSSAPTFPHPALVNFSLTCGVGEWSLGNCVSLPQSPLSSYLHAFQLKVSDWALPLPMSNPRVWLP